MATFDKTKREIKRGDVYFMEPPLYSERTCLYEKTRPHVILAVCGNFVVCLPLTTTDKSKQLGYHVRVHDRKNNTDKYVVCNMPLTIPVEKISDLMFVMPNHYMRQIDTVFAKNMGIPSMDLGFLYDPIVKMVREQLNNERNGKTISVLEQCIGLLSELSESLKEPKEKDDEKTIQVIPTNDVSEEVAATFEEPSAKRTAHHNKFFTEEDALRYTKYYLAGSFGYIKKVFGDTKSTAENRIKYLKTQFDSVREIVESSTPKTKTKRKFRKFDREQNIDYAKHAADKDYDYIQRVYGDDKIAAQKRFYYMKSNIEYIKEMF